MNNETQNPGRESGPAREAGGATKTDKIGCDRYLECSCRIGHVSARHHALVKMLGQAIARGDFTASEVLGALPAAVEWAGRWRFVASGNLGDAYMAVDEDDGGDCNTVGGKGS